MRVKLDDDDFNILHELSNDSRQSLVELSKKLNLPRSTIHSKIKRLERHKVIEKYTIKMNMHTLKQPLLAFIMINFDQHDTNMDQETVALNIANLPMVEECHLLAGEYDIMIKVRAEGIDALGDFSIKNLKKIRGVGRSLTYVVMKKIKDSNTAPYISDSIAAPYYIEGAPKEEIGI